MQNPRSRILQKYRLRPQKKGRLPNFTQDFQEYSDKINQVIKNQVQFSFELNKFGIEKRRRISNLSNIVCIQQRSFKINLEEPRIQVGNEMKVCGKNLRYNETKISPDHKLKIRNKSSKKIIKEISQPIISQIKQVKLNESIVVDKLPKINLTSRQMINNNKYRDNKQNDPQHFKTSRIHPKQINPKQKYFTKLYHIVTMGRKQINTKF